MAATSSTRHLSRSLRRTSALLVASLLAAGLAWTDPASALSITSAGPLTNVTISPDLNCAVNHTGDASGEFFGDTACGTLIAVAGTLYGPAAIPAGSSASPRTGYTPVSQVTAGTGTTADPFRIITVVDAGSSGIRLTQTDTYVVGQESYRTDVQVANTTGAAVSAVLYKAGDCYLQNSDAGFGAFDAATGAVSCVAGITGAGDATVPGSRIEQFFPLTPGSRYLESGYQAVWAAVGTQQPLPNQCAQCTSYIDNGIGLSWNLAVPAGTTTSVSHFTTFSPLGIVPLTTTKTADSATATAGGTDGYTIAISNPNTTAATLDAITDTLPAGFTYRSGTSTGATTSNPTVTGQDLRWAGPLIVPAGGNLSLHFGVTVSTTPGQYLNVAGATSSALAVAPTGPTASITVTAPTTTTTTTVPSTTTTVASTTTTVASTTTTVASTTTTRVPATTTTTVPPQPGTTVAPPPAAVAPPPARLPSGYRLAAEDGGIFVFGGLGFFGSTGGVPPNEEVVGMANTPSREGYWSAVSDGGVSAFGDARSFGSLRGRPHGGQVVGIAATPTGNGYWLVTSDGGVYTFGDARFSGSKAGTRLSKPIVGIAATPSGNGYWLVASDGGVFTFGDARFFGSTAGARLHQPIVGMAATRSGDGYWLVAADGGVFAFGDAPFLGSLGGTRLNKPIVGMAADPSGRGYLMVAKDGGVFTFGGAPFLGSMAGRPLFRPVVAIAA